MEAIARFQGNTPVAQLFTLATAVLSLPRLLEFDALVIYPGMGEHWRVAQAVALWERLTSARYLLVAGYNPAEHICKPLTVERLRTEFGLRREEGVISQIHTQNTKTQSDWVARQLREHAIASAGLCTAPYHIVRAYLTLLKSLLVGGQQIPVFPIPTPVGLEASTPELGISTWELAAGEAERILRYQATGDVATLAEVRSYLNWLWQQPILATSTL